MDDARPKMCFNPSAPPTTPETIFSSNLTFGYKCSSDHISVPNSDYYYFQDCNNNNNNNNITDTKEQDNMQNPEDLKNVKAFKTDEETTSDYKQWLHAMKLVASLPGGIPPEFRRKLWLSLADKYLKSKNIDWVKEEEKCFCEKWREDDEELGIQIVKDLHRTGSTLCTGPAGDINQAKLKRILLGYARYNPEVGYCQGFNMLGALILQVMEKDESESIKVMIYLVEGILPTGYFCGSMGGLQTDMAVFRELMQTKLPRLAKHLQKLQGPVENAYEPPLTNVFTMQWFLTMFCTCLPMSCVLRVWDLVLIEGSDVLLRTALALWSLLEERVLNARSADDFYGKMGSFSSELLNGHLIDSNGLIEKIVQLGPIADIQKLRDKHLYNMAPIESQQGLQLYFDEDEPDINEDSRLVVATVWGIPWGRRCSQGQSNTNITKQTIENKDRIALDISLLKKQYDKLRERQKQAQIILTTACSTASRQSSSSTPLPVNQLLPGRPAIVTKKGRRSGPLIGAIPPARKPSLPAVLQEKSLGKQLKRGETLHWRDMKDIRPRRDSLSWKEIKAERTAMITSESIDELKSQKIRSSRLAKSDSSSYSEESDDNNVENAEDASSTETSLCDDDLQPVPNDAERRLHFENTHKFPGKTLHKIKKSTSKQRNKSANSKDIREKTRPKSWAPSSTEIPFMLMTSDSPTHSADEKPELDNLSTTEKNVGSEGNDKLIKKAQTNQIQEENFKLSDELFMPKMDEVPSNRIERKNLKEEENIPFLSTTTPMRGSNEKDDAKRIFDISNEGVTNEYFERVNSTERPTKLDLLYSLNEDENVRDVFNINKDEFVKTNEDSRPFAKYRSLNNSNNVRCMDLLVDYSEKSSAACIEEAKTEISTTFQSFDASAAISLQEEHLGFTKENLFKSTKGISEKRRNPRRLTLTRSSTVDIEKRFEALEKRLSMDACTSFKRFSNEAEFNEDMKKSPDQSNCTRLNKSSTASNYPYDHIIYHTTLLPEMMISQHKKIPSTADLEERFENIQQQLVRDRNKMMVSDSESTEKQTTLNTSFDNNILRSPKDDNPSKQAKKPDDNEGTEEVEEKKILSANSDIEENLSASTEFEDGTKVNTVKNTKSTALQVSRSTKSEIETLKTKKEPPDESKNKHAAGEDDANKKANAEIETSKNKESNLKKDDRKSNSEMLEERKGSEQTSPPSTEELEKRFCALEEQMNSVKNESDKAGHNLQCRKQYKIEKTSGKTSTDTSQTGLDNKFEHLSDKTAKRRLSEPPSIEDLDKRYEVMKRRMSSRNFETKSLHKDGPCVNAEKTKKSNSHTNKDDVSINLNSKKPSPPSIENLEERFEKLQNKGESKFAITTPSPPSTKNLEERFEKLQNRNEPKATPSNDNPDKISQIKTQNPDIDPISPVESDQILNKEDGESASDNKSKLEKRNSMIDSIARNAKSSDGKVTPMVQEEVEDVSDENVKANVIAKNANTIKLKLIEELQAKIKENSINSELDKIIKKKTALIEELKAKADPLQNTFLKPTQISCGRSRSPFSQRTFLTSPSFNDETLESHAASAYRKSEKYEPPNSAKRKMVRRFSDLPSRADLENRLQFLEEQLSKTVCMQRRSSDSEVASKARFTHKAALSNVSTSGSLEHRVQELEKRLNDNRTFSMDVECSNANEKNGSDIEISQVELATDTVTATGKELVRYSSHGEVGDFDHPNPINISINIQMTLNKDDVESKKISDDVIDRRLQRLEQQFKITQVHDLCEIVTKEVTLEKDPEINVNVMENSNENEKIANKNEEKEGETLIEINPSISEHFQSCNITEKLIQSEEKSLADKVDIPCQLTEKNQQLADSKSERDVSDNTKEKSKSQIHSTFCNSEQELANNTGEDIDKERKIVDQIKPEDHLKIENSSKESFQSSIKEIKNQANLSQQKFQESETIESQEHSLSQPNETSEQKISEQGDRESINKNVDNIEAKIKSETEKIIASNKCSQIVPVEINKKTLVLLLDNEPKAVKVRRLTRANTEELEGLFQALEKQLNDREQQKGSEIKTNTASEEKRPNKIETSQTISCLAREIEEFSKAESQKSEINDKVTKVKPKTQEEEFDWGSDPNKYHLKKRTVYLPSTKELEARFRSLERQIRLLEDVEKIDVEQRLIEIERKIKLQYSLSHEKDLNKFLELCEGKDLDEMPKSIESYPDRKDYSNEVKFDQKCTSRHASPSRLKELTSTVSGLEHCYHSLELKKSKSKQSSKKQPIHPLEMLLDPSPDDNDIPTTGELEHRIHVMEENRRSPSPSARKSRSQSPHIKQNNAMNTTSPTERGLPTAEELEARLEALEKEHCFNFKMQKNFQQFNQKLKDVISPSKSSDELKSSTKSCDSGHIKTSKQTSRVNTISPKNIRFCEDEQSIPQRELESKKTLLDDKGTRQIAKVLEGPGVMGIRLMRETSPLRRKGTHTGIPLRTGENINDQLTSIQNTIKSIDSLCEEKPYRKERCQQYIDSLFADSTHFAHKKTSLEDLTSHNIIRTGSREIGPCIRVSDQSPPFARSMGSADSIHSSSPLRSSSPLQYRSNRDLRREPSPRHRRDEDQEEYESRVRRDNLLPNNFNCSHSTLSHTSSRNLTKFHKVDSQLIPNGVERETEENLRQPTFSTIDSFFYHDNINTSDNVNETSQATLNTKVIASDLFKRQALARPILPLCQTISPSLNTPTYTPAKLEIRHTTVTSTFYDRVLTEKQLEKQHHQSFLTNNQSPMISPLFERQQQIAKSPTKLLNTDTINTLSLTDASTGKFHS